MSHPDHARWQQCWRDKQTDFHLAHVHPLLKQFWPTLDLGTDDRVFVPLCGKSRDLMWLRTQGHHVTGVELSPVAVRTLFKESRLQAVRTQDTRFTRWEQAGLRIFCGDFFALSADDLLGTRAVYDRAALTALPEDLRPAYISHLAAILPADCVQLLLTIEDLEEEEDESSVLAISEEVLDLYDHQFLVSLRHAACFPATLAADGHRGEGRSVHKVYKISKRLPD